MNPMEVIDADTAVELGVADELIGELRKRLTGRKADTHAGYEMVLAGIAEVTKYRTGVDRAGMELKISHIAYQKKVNAEVKRVKGLLLEIETPLRAEKARIDDEAERWRKDKEEKERLAIEAKELAEQEARDAEEAAQREAERKEREEAAAQLVEDRKSLEAYRQKIEDEQQVKREEIEKDRQKVADQLEAIEADRQAFQDKARKQREAINEKRRKAQEVADRAIAAEAEKIRLAKEKAEQERLAEERKPDKKKLQDFGDRIQDLESPELKTEWGNTVLATVWDHLQSACDAAYCEDAATEDELVASDAAETVVEQ